MTNLDNAASAPSLPADLPAELLAIVRTTTAEEQDVLPAFLDYFRAIIVRKAAGLSEEQVRTRHVGSATTIGGLIKHLAAVEEEWFGLFEGHSAEPSGDHTFQLTDEDSVPTLIAGYEQACARSRAAVAGRALSAAVTQSAMGEVSLRWVYVHMIEETARHVGHLDILRELTDGATGVLG